MPRYVKAAYDFDTTEAGEIALRAGDVVRVVRQVDTNWLQGEIHGRVGNFPSNFVTELELPSVSNGQKLFEAVRSFPAEVQGDLGFQKGDILIGTRNVDANWWEGRCGNLSGIFPVTHVVELDLDNSSHPATSTTPTPPPGAPVSHQAPPPGGHIAVVRAHMNLTAQIDDELSFRSGDVIRVLEVIDADFCLGECHGMKGQFPVWCVDVIEGNLNAFLPKQEKRTSKFNKWWQEGGTGGGGGSDGNHRSNSQHSPALVARQPDPPSPLPCVATTPVVDNATPNVNSNASQSQTVKNHIENIKNEFIIQKKNDNNNSADATCFEKTPRRNRSYTTESFRSYDAEVTPYGKTLFPFIAENPNELTFFDNEIVVLIRYVDDQWMEGEINGQRGIFPINYIDIIVDCARGSEPQSGTTPAGPSLTLLPAPVGPGPGPEAGPPDTPGGQGPDTPGQTPDTPGGPYPEEYGEDVYGRVLFDFTAESDRDLDMVEGDTVTVLRKLNEHWFEARHDNGRVGLCPVTFVELIVSDPPPPRLVPSRQSSVTQETPTTPLPPPTAKHPHYANVPTTPDVRTVDSDLLSHTPRSADCSDVTKDAVTSSSSPAVPSTPCDKPADTPTPPAVTRPKPGLKPKPQLKPKPALHRNVSVGSEMTKSQPPSHVTRKSMSIDSDSGVTPPPPPRTVSPQPINKRLSMPVFSQSQTPGLDGSLDDIIQNELRSAGGGATSRLSTSSTESVKSPSVMISGDSVQFKLPGSSKRPKVEPLNAASLSTSTGQSQFIGGGTAGLAPPRSPGGVTNRPVPARPPPPPPAQQNKRPAPARPAGPSVAPAPSKSPLTPTKMQQDYGPKPVPQRPAPPRPNRRPGDNLMHFSPDHVTAEPVFNLHAGVGVEDEAVDAEVIADLQNRIKETQKDIQKHSNAKQELEQMLLVVEETDKPEIEDNIAFYDANLSGLTQELEQLKQNLCEVSPAYAASEAEAKRREEEARRRVEQERKRQEEERREREELRQKRVAKRQHVIEELLQTEQDYLQSLNLVMHVFLAADAEKCAGCDLEMLFGNMDEVVEVSQKLLTSLEAATKGKDFSEQIVGESFILLKEDMKKVYAPYCRNHDDVLALLSRYEEMPEIQEYFSRQIEIMKLQATVFDLGSCLIKPVQRVLKYPLLLNELIQATEEEHADKQRLLTAINAMTDVAHAINEYKRRKDLVLKYRKDTDLRFSEKIAKFGAHSAKKKLNRLTQKMVGVVTVDEEFNREEKKFVNLEKAVRTLVRNISTYLEQVQDAVFGQESVANDISDYYGDKSSEKEVRQNCEVHNKVATTLFHQFKDAMELEVLSPLNKLLVMFQGPTKVIKKRHDKLLDYDNMQSKVKGVKDATQQKILEKDLERTKNNYAALNAQLLDELPQLYAMSMDVVNECIARLVHAQAQYHSHALNEMYQLLALPLIMSGGENNVVEAFNIAHTTVVEQLSDLSFIPRSFNPRLEDRKSTKSKRMPTSGPFIPENEASGVQSDSQRMYVRQMYPASRLYHVTADHTASQIMDVTLPRGTLVGIIKEGDPMGNKERWFVDNGALKGFIPKKFLSPMDSTSGPAQSGPVPAAPPPSRPLASSPTIPERSSPGGAPAAVVLPSGNLMDLTSPTEPVKEKTLLPLDLDFSLSSGTTWYGQQPWEASDKDKLEMETQVDWGATNSTTHHEEEPPPAYDDVTGSPQQPTQQQQQPEEQPQYYRAVYGFQARSDIEISMAEGQVVPVLQQHDLDGNPDWWLIEVDGNQGYVPANYLYNVQ